MLESAGPQILSAHYWSFLQVSLKMCAVGRGVYGELICINNYMGIELGDMQFPKLHDPNETNPSHCGFSRLQDQV